MGVDAVVSLRFVSPIPRSQFPQSVSSCTATVISTFRRHQDVDGWHVHECDLLHRGTHKGHIRQRVHVFMFESRDVEEGSLIAVSRMGVDAIAH
jgi:hypothetical protein